MHEKKYFIFNCIQTYGFLILLIITAGLFNSYIFYDETYTGFYFFITSDKWARNAIPRYPNKNYFNKSERSGKFIKAKTGAEVKPFDKNRYYAKRFPYNEDDCPQ